MKSAYLYFPVFITILLTACSDRKMEIVTVPKDQDGSIQQTKTSPQTNRWKTPEHWIQKSASSMRIATFEIRTNDRQAVLSITAFPGDVGGKLANINRWLNQMNMQATDSKGLESYTKDIKFGKNSGYTADLQSASKAMYTVALRVMDKTWFFKMTGDREILEKEKENLHQFIHSIQF